MALGKSLRKSQKGVESHLTPLRLGEGEGVAENPRKAGGGDSQIQEKFAMNERGKIAVSLARSKSWKK